MAKLFIMFITSVYKKKIFIESFVSSQFVEVNHANIVYSKCRKDISQLRYKVVLRKPLILILTSSLLRQQLQWPPQLQLFVPRILFFYSSRGLGAWRPHHLGECPREALSRRGAATRAIVVGVFLLVPEENSSSLGKDLGTLP